MRVLSDRPRCDQLVHINTVANRNRTKLTVLKVAFPDREPKLVGVENSGNQAVALCADKIRLLFS